ncbi:MAG: enoyl-CoA hydratase/isomerase family protein, partial [Gammaproteobacteria bacterium]|nr:enoyl-CoA hydratase/isomerase family protein [Gammaproteobacteria bacterium]
MTDFQTIELNKDARGFATLWLNRPEKNNAFNAEMIRELVQAIDTVQADKSLRFLLLRGRGKHFSAGADLAWMQQSAKLDFDANLTDARELAELMYSLYHLKLRTLAVVQGAAFGGAVGLVACCD